MENQQTSPRQSEFAAALGALFNAASAAKNVRAIVLMGVTFILATAITGFFSMIAMRTWTPSLAALGALLSVIVVFYGVNAVGILLMRQSQDLQAGIVEAVLQSLFTSHRLLLVILVQGVIVLAVMVLIAIVFFICKIPFLGPIVFTVAMPVSAVILGVLMFGLFYILLPLAGPAVWSGSTVSQTIACLNGLVRARLLHIVMQQVLLFMIVIFVSSFIFMVIGLGLGMVTGLSAAVIGMGGSSGFFDLLMRGEVAYAVSRLGSGSGGHVAAAAIGNGILLSVAGIIPALIVVKGLCLIFLNSSLGLDFSAAEAQLESGMSAVKKKAEEARARARELAEQQMEKAREAAAAAAAKRAAATAPSLPLELAPEQKDTARDDKVIDAEVKEAPQPTQPETGDLEAAAHCPKCAVEVAPDQVFCGECGNKLK